jgi:hypothetical protein
MRYFFVSAYARIWVGSFERDKEIIDSCAFVAVFMRSTNAAIRKQDSKQSISVNICAEWNEEEYESDTVAEVDSIAAGSASSVTVSQEQPPVAASAPVTTAAATTMNIESPVSGSAPSLVTAQSGSLSTTVEPPATAAEQVVAGVNLTQLPPVQRELFLRLHQQQRNNAIPEQSALVTSTATSSAATDSMSKMSSHDP